MRNLKAVTTAICLALLATGTAQARPHAHPAATAAVGQADSSRYYTNVSGHRVHRPVQAAQRPSGATARCADGSYSFSEHRRGTCSYHGGVATWYAF
jgi:hypothetical protein